MIKYYMSEELQRLPMASGLHRVDLEWMQKVARLAENAAPVAGDGKIPARYIPEYFNDIVDYPAKSAFPEAGETGKFYVDSSDGSVYRWDPTAGDGGAGGYVASPDPLTADVATLKTDVATLKTHGYVVSEDGKVKSSIGGAKTALAKEDDVVVEGVSVYTDWTVTPSTLTAYIAISMGMGIPITVYPVPVRKDGGWRIYSSGNQSDVTGKTNAELLELINRGNLTLVPTNPAVLGTDVGATSLQGTYKFEGMNGWYSISASRSLVSRSTDWLRLRGQPDQEFASKAAVEGKVDKETGKGLSTNDFTDAYKGKLDSLDTNLGNKVDKVSGKGLSTNDFTAAYKGKLDDLDANLAKRVPLEVDVDGTFTAATIGVQRKPGSAKGKLSLVQGYLCAAEGGFSHAEGDRTEATQVASHAEGSQTSATANASHAEGGSTKAAGVASHAEGLYTRSSGYAAHAEGTNADGLVQGLSGTEAAGPFSHTEGLMCETKEEGFGSHASGFRASDDGKSFTFVWQGYGGDVPTAAQMADLIENGPTSPNGGATAVQHLTTALNNLSAYKAKHKGAFCVKPVPASGSNDPASGLFVGDTSLAQLLAGKVAANTAVVGGTKCKITFDSKGLVTAGANLAASDIPMLSTAKLSDFATAVRYSSNSATVTPSSGDPALPDSCYPIVVVTSGGEEHSIEDASGVNLYFDGGISTWMLNGEGPLDFTLAYFDENTLAFGGAGLLDSITFGGQSPVQGSFPRLSSPPATVTNVADRAVNTFTLSGNASLTLPNGTQNRLRDFYLKVSANSMATLTVTDATLVDAVGNPVSLAVAAGATVSWHLTETSTDTFLVEGANEAALVGFLGTTKLGKPDYASAESKSSAAGNLNPTTVAAITGSGSSAAVTDADLFAATVDCMLYLSVESNTLNSSDVTLKVAPTAADAASVTIAMIHVSNTRVGHAVLPLVLKAGNVVKVTTTGALNSVSGSVVAIV